MSSLQTITPPTVEPVSLAEMKLYLRVDNAAEDAEITEMITDAREWVEERTNRRLVEQTVKWVLDLDWHRQGIIVPEQEESFRVPERYADKLIRNGLWLIHQPTLRFPVAPVTAVSAMTYRVGGTDVDYPDLAQVRTEFEGRIIFSPWALPPLPDEQVGALSITATCGYGPAAADVPGRYKRAIRLLCGHWYENRGLYIMPNGPGRIVPNEMAAGLTDLLRQDRRLGL